MLTLSGLTMLVARMALVPILLFSNGWRSVLPVSFRRRRAFFWRIVGAYDSGMNTVIHRVVDAEAMSRIQ